MRTATPTAKDNSNYNTFTLKYIELGIYAELSLKLEREKTFFRVLGTTRTLEHKRYFI